MAEQLDTDNLFQHFTCVAAALLATHKLNVGGYPLLNGGLFSSVHTNPSSADHLIFF